MPKGKYDSMCKLRNAEICTKHVAITENARNMRKYANKKDAIYVNNKLKYAEICKPKYAHICKTPYA